MAVAAAVVMMVVMAGDLVRVHKVRDERRDRFEITDFGGEPFIFGFADIGRLLTSRSSDSGRRRGR